MPLQDPPQGTDVAVGQEDGTAGPAEPPKVVTRTRGRSASRAAGPPALAASDGTSPAGDVPAVEHVPIKKKGARKR